MVTKLSAAAIRRYRALRLGLNGAGLDVVRMVDANGGLHATSFMTPYLSLIVRGIDSPFHLLNHIQFKERKVVRVRAMRGTLFILPASRLHLLLGAFRTKPRFLNKFYEQWKVTPESVAPSRKRLLDALSMRAVTLKELKEYLGDLAEKQLAGKRTDRTPMLNFLLQLLQMEGLIVSEKIVIQNSARTVNRYAAVQFLYPQLPPSPPEEECLSEVLRWYFETQGPADLDDMAWWSGLNKIVLKKIAAGLNLTEVEVDPGGKRLFMFKEQIKEIQRIPDVPLPGIKLLPYEDSYLKGHKDRGLLLSGVPEATVFERGESRPVICYDGRVVGLWRFVEQGEDLRIGVELFDKNVVDMEELKPVKEKVIEFVTSHFWKNLESGAKSILTGAEPYS